MKNAVLTGSAIILIAVFGLTTPGWGGSDPSHFDSSNAGKSALGQLEDIAGQKVDTSAAAMPRPSTINTYKKTIIPPQRPVAKPKPKVAPQPSMEAMVTGMVMGSLLNAVFSDNSQQAANEAAARAMAEAEQKRLQEEQRQQRLQAAGRLRDAWDQRDQEISDSLGDAFSLPGQGQGTNFFSAAASSGRPALDEAPVKINATGKPLIIGGTVPDVQGVALEPQITAEPNAFQEGLLKKGVEYAQEKAVETAKDKLQDMALDLLPDKTAANIKLMLEYKGRFKDWTDNLFQALDSKRLVAAAAGDGEAYAAVMQDLDKAQHQALSLPFGSPLSDKEQDYGYKLLAKKSVTFEETKQIAIERLKGMFSEDLEERLLGGLS